MKSAFLLRSMLVAFVNMAGLYGLNQLLVDHSVPAVSYYFVLGFWLLTVLLHTWLTGQGASRPQRFVSYFMGAITVKLFATLIFLLVYLLTVGEERIVVALSAFVTYVLFTALQVSTLYNRKTD
ncbi:MAG: hypothetical protein EA392_14980 [Cryomorphaceae bacterium]|nr:MAG: hypothetical protein EA392_14980 [Cryomorphaceae bacterium]